ncbi:MAG: AI-2E family transporter [Pseudomonadota bacterium]|nr:AI-2E family transporter [Pseudomonadota bacterium]
MADPSIKRADDRALVRRTLIVLALVALAVLFWELRNLLLMLFGAVVVATVFRALADRICKLTKVREGLAVAISIILVLGALGGLIALFGAHLLQQVQTLGQTLPVAWQSFEQRVGDLGLGDQLRRLAEGVRESSGSFANLSRAVMSVGNAIAEILIVLFGGIYLAAQPRVYKGGVIKLIPAAKRPLVAEAMDESETALRLWLKGQLIAMVAVGLLTGIGLWLLGLPSALVLGLLAGLLEFVPFLGPILSAVPAILLALAVSPDLALAVLVLYVAVQQFEGYVITPLVQQYAVELPGMILLFSLLGFGILFGTLGVILAAPLTVVCYVLVKRLYVIEALHTPTPIPGEKE